MVGEQWHIIPSARAPWVPEVGSDGWSTRAGRALPHSQSPPCHCSQGPGQAWGSLGHRGTPLQGWAGAGAQLKLGQDITLRVRIRVRPGEGNQGQTQPRGSQDPLHWTFNFLLLRRVLLSWLVVSALIPIMLLNHYYLFLPFELTYLERCFPGWHWMFSDCHWLSYSSCQSRISSKLNFLSSQCCATAWRLKSILLFFTCKTLDLISGNIDVPQWA